MNFCREIFFFYFFSAIFRWVGGKGATWKCEINTWWAVRKLEKCVKCPSESTFGELKPTLKSKNLPLCSKCEAIMRPPIVFYKETLDYTKSVFQNHLKDSDLVLILGTPLAVDPIGNDFLVNISKSNVVILINFDVLTNHNVISEKCELIHLQNSIDMITNWLSERPAYQEKSCSEIMKSKVAKCLDCRKKKGNDGCRFVQFRQITPTLEFTFFNEINEKKEDCAKTERN